MEKEFKVVFNGTKIAEYDLEGDAVATADSIFSAQQDAGDCIIAVTKNGETIFKLP